MVPPIDEGEAAARTGPCPGGHVAGRRVHLLVIGDNTAKVACTLARDMASSFPKLCVDRIDDGEALEEYNSSLAPDDHVALGFITSEVEDMDPVLALARRMPILEATHWVVVTQKESHEDLTRAINSGRLASVVTVPWTLPLLVGQCYSIISRHLRDEGMTETQIDTLIGPPPDTAVQGPLLEGLDQSATKVVRELLDGVQSVLGWRPRIVLPAGTELTRQGEPVSAVYLILEGHVSLHRDSLGGEVLAHHATSGRLIGLVTLARGEDAFFTATTTTPVRVIRLTNEQLQLALGQKPELVGTLTVLAIQSLTRRLMRAEDLHLENAMLATNLEKERERLADALSALEATREELVERTRFAMLGELSAGIAHELNNPVTALVRSAEHLAEDVDRLLAVSKDTATARSAMNTALTAPPRSTAMERQQVADLLPVLRQDRVLARRLVKAGVTDPAAAKKMRRAPERELEAVESGARVGSSLRSVLAAGERVIELTQSLKGYARPDAEEMREVDVRVGLDDVLRLTKHRMRGIEVEFAYEEAPHILAHPGKLQQIWTNLLVNAAEALDDEAEDIRTRNAQDPAAGLRPARGEDPPSITAKVFAEDGPHGASVVVEIHDNGPGIPPALVEKIFEPHFTTKAGRVRYGLGMGMSISRSIVSDLGGLMTICSTPGDTTIRVTLPAVGTAASAQAPSVRAVPAPLSLFASPAPSSPSTSNLEVPR